MPSPTHQALTDLFRNRPELAAEMLAETLGWPFLGFKDATLVSGDISDLNPTEYRADAVVTLTDASGAFSAIVVEVQLRRDKDKHWTWPVYLATLRARLRCPTVLLVVCADPRTADWCTTPIDMGHPGWTLQPVVLGPEGIPLVTDAGEASLDLELAVLSVMARTDHPDWKRAAGALLTAFGTTKNQHAHDYYEIVRTLLPAAARRILEAMVTTGTYKYQSEFARRYFTEGQARAVLTSCTDLALLEVWVRRAATATSVDDLFA